MCDLDVSAMGMTQNATVDKIAPEFLCSLFVNARRKRMTGMCAFSLAVLIIFLCVNVEAYMNE